MTRRCVILALALAFCALLLGGVAAETVDLSATPKVNNGVAAPTGKATDAGSAAREKESMSNAGVEKFTFQAEVNRLMDIIINSLYSNKDIFLRELISNASDALDKLRFLSLTDKNVLGEGEVAQLEIKVSLDKNNKVLMIRDRGVGMTKDDLIKNLGTIAKSGTSAFLEMAQKGGDINLIGQFGMGFYSVYLVSDFVEVITKHNDDKQYIWSSHADGTFTIEEDAEGEQLGRGTLIKVHLKPEALEYAEEAKLKELIQKYSEFINFPIYLLQEKEVEVPDDDEPAEPEKKEDEEADDEEDGEEEEDSDDEVSDDDEEEEAEKPKKMKKIKRDDWEKLNDNKAIWLRKPSEVTKGDYEKFYTAISKDYSGAMTWSHFKAEGDVEFRSILYIPQYAQFNFYDKYYENQVRGLKLYVRRVFISDDFTELIPRYLSFLRGIVDSDTLPLNVSREMLQQHASLKTIKKKLTRKALDLIKGMADEEKRCKEMSEDDRSELSADEHENCARFGTKFWPQFGKAIKLGIMEDTINRNRLAKLLRFRSSQSPDKDTSLEEYVERMKEGQKDIYFVTGATQDECKESPFVERLLKKGYEVIYFSDVLDEYVMQHLLEFDDKKFANVSKENLKLGDKDEDERKEFKELKKDLKPLTEWWNTLLAGKVTAVKVSSRLDVTPCVVVTGQYGNSANMERIQRYQAFNGPNKDSSKAQRTLEINPRHPLIKSLKDKVASDSESEEVKESAMVLFETALLESGFELDDNRGFSRRVYTILAENMKTEATVEPEVEAPAASKPSGAKEEKEPSLAEKEEL